MCSECHGNYANCPICSPTPKYTTCPDCAGSGLIYFTERGDAIIKEVYDRLDVDDRTEEVCERCDGEGVVEEQADEPDPDQRYEQRREERV